MVLNNVKRDVRLGYTTWEVYKIFVFNVTSLAIRRNAYGLHVINKTFFFDS